jgi:hypothetical protein
MFDSQVKTKFCSIYPTFTSLSHPSLSLAGYWPPYKRANCFLSWLPTFILCLELKIYKIYIIKRLIDKSLLNVQDLQMLDLTNVWNYCQWMFKHFCFVFWKWSLLSHLLSYKIQTYHLHFNDCILLINYYSRQAEEIWSIIS